MAVLADLRSVFTDWQAGLRDFLGRPVQATRNYVLFNHLILIAHAPVFSVLAPWPWFHGSHFSWTTRIILPVLIPVAFILLAAVFERLSLYEKGPSMDDRSRGKNALVFLCLPVCAAGFTYMIHPALGLLLTLLFGAYSMVLAVRASMQIWSLSFDRVIFRFAGAFFFIMLPLITLLIARNMLQSLGILRRLLHG